MMWFQILKDGDGSTGVMASIFRRYGPRGPANRQTLAGPAVLGLLLKSLLHQFEAVYL